MDLDALQSAREAEWTRLEALAAAGRTSGRDTDELIRRYQDAATDLSTISSTAGATPLGDRLAVTLSRARMRLTRAGTDPFGGVPRFFVLQLPAALYRLRRWTLVVALVTAAIAVVYGVWAARDPRVLAAVGDSATLKQLVDHDFVNYYSANPAAEFTGQVWTNNALLAAECIALGVFGVFVPVIVLQNAMNIGITGGILIAYGRADTFFLYIAPHGLLELTSLFTAAAGGMRIFWSWIAPGARTRAQALAEDARALFTVAIGLTISLFVSGCIEGFVTPSPLPWPVKIGIGAVALAAFLTYMLVVGRRAVRLGETGDIEESAAGARRIAVA